MPRMPTGGTVVKYTTYCKVLEEHYYVVLFLPILNSSLARPRASLNQLSLFHFLHKRSRAPSPHASSARPHAHHREGALWSVMECVTATRGRGRCGYSVYDRCRGGLGVITNHTPCEDPRPVRAQTEHAARALARESAVRLRGPIAF